MRVTGIIEALDLGSRTGFAAGEPGAPPFSGAVVLKQTEESRAVAIAALIEFLDTRWRSNPPKLLVIEAAMSLGAFKVIGNSESNVRMTYGLHGVVEGMARRFRVRLETVAPATARKHFIGKANAGNRERTKEAVVARAHLLKLLPKQVYDEDRADALAIWDWGCAMFGQRSASIDNLKLYKD